MSNTITMSNYIFSSQIDVHSKIVYAGLKKHSNCEGVCFPSRNTLVELCKISLSTVRKAINCLVEAKILDKQSRYRGNGSQTSNLYSLTTFMTSGDYYFKVRSDIFELELSEKEIIVYMYLCSCANKENVCFPSLRQIAAACSISQTSVKAAIKELIERKLIIKDNQFREDGGKRNNIYLIVPEDNNNLIIEDASAAHELCDEINQSEILEAKEDEVKIAEVIFNQDQVINESEDTSESENAQIEYIFHTDLPNEKIKVNIRDNIFDFKLSKHSVLVYLYICTHSELKTKDFPSYEQMANVCKIGIAKVANAMLELRNNGLIVKLKQEKTDDTMAIIEPPPWAI